ncbi:hypothetical protein SAMN04489722_10120 [Algibacter lectus]|uniref:hypothetical protein n=1 Tax=Algibacter lectus TaxID=221126 RepID=UPI0008EBBD9E|nr:hypothetical protein [Algibacter lectus]SFB82315.1 hypothetical protein SAMN04489722_10120 [Algibacter lectus]
MKNLISFGIAFLMVSVNLTAQCTDINTKEIANYLNEKVKPRLDIKLDRTDGFVAINGTRQNLDLQDIKISPIKREWTYFFQDVRRADSNFWYDSKKNSFILDVKFENNGIEIKGRCEGCITNRMKDSRAPDIEWRAPQILRFTLKPITYQRSVSFEVTEVEMIGKLEGGGLAKVIKNLTANVGGMVSKDLKRFFATDVTKRLLNDAMRPLLKSKNTVSANSVSLASTSLRVCK